VATQAALFEPDLLRRLEGLALQVRRSVLGEMAGERRSPTFGRSVEFADFRSYSPGDDFRLIDWKAYARLDRFLLRLYHAEQELPLNLFVDLSGSMDWGNPNKAWVAKQLAGALAYVALASLDRVRVTVFADTAVPTRTTYRGRRAAPEVFRVLATAPVGGRTDYSRLVWPLQRQRPGMSVLISDGLGDASAVESSLTALQRAQQQGALIQLLAPQEIDPDWSGDARLRDAETAAEREFTLTPITRETYLQRLAERTRLLEDSAHRHGLAFARFSSSEPIHEMVRGGLGRLGLIK
jgi:uncharacterized protein (DUF58 family)